VGGKKDSDLVRLIRGEDNSLWLSRPERRLLKFALDAFGEQLSRFLLSGLGEEGRRRAWLFAVTFTDGGGVSRRRDIRVEADDFPDVVTSLPGRREPLVMLALLRLLMDRQPFSPGLSYDQAEVLGLLGWEDSPDTRLSIDEAVGRYVDLSYRWSPGAEELAEQRLSHYRAWARFVTGCGYRDAGEGPGGRMMRASNRVEFSSEFVGELANRSVFGVDWNKVISLSRATST
jgi:hypothetical protein